jgi:hypothetical protein
MDSTQSGCAVDTLDAVIGGGLAVRTYVAKPVPDVDEFSTFLWWTLIFLALFLSCFALFKAIEWLRNRRALRSGAATSQPETAKDPWDQAINSRPAGDRTWTTPMERDMGGLGGMTQREQEILFSTYGPRTVRKEMKQRLRAREQKERDR